MNRSLNHLFMNLVPNPCQSASCSHLCLLIRGGYRCSCPDSTNSVLSLNGQCTTAFEQPKALPHRCQCRNGGSCVQSDAETSKIICKCLENFEGSNCEEYIPRSQIGGDTDHVFAAIILPILIVVLTLGLAAGLYTYFKRKNS